MSEAPQNSSSITTEHRPTFNSIKALYPNRRAVLGPKRRTVQTGESSHRRDKKPIGRTVGSSILVVLTVLLLAVAVPSLWLKTVIPNEGQWVATIASLADSPEIQQAVADQVFQS